MRCLWLTYTDPEPRHNGQLLYSGGLIDAAAANGAQIDVLGLARPGSTAIRSNESRSVNWQLSRQKARKPWQSLLSSLPHMADRSWTPELRRMLDERLAAGRWDAIVFDSIAAGWALPVVLRHYPQRRHRPRIVYISHNHEASLRSLVARNHPDFIKRQVLRMDAAKAWRLERSLIEAADLITAITPEDRDQYMAHRPDRRVEILTPGYSGPRAAGRRISKDLPRRAIIVGSFDWIAKRINLEQFIETADRLFAAHNAELYVVGSADEGFLRHMRRRVTATRFTGTVEDVPSFMQEARLALVVERFGGGFKLKALDYVFHRIPILALSGSVAGMPLRDDDSILYYPDYEALARGALDIIDDCERLNTLHDRAFDACCDSFDWSKRGQMLLSAIGAT